MKLKNTDLHDFDEEYLPTKTNEFILNLKNR